MVADIVEEARQQLPLVSLNHVSFLCTSVLDSVRFYEQVLGFVLIKRPSSFNFEGAWLFNYGIGIHLLKSPTPGEVMGKKGPINPKSNHISFQCSNIGSVVYKLKELGIDYVTAVVEEGGVKVNQLFFHDPDGYMIEICNCEALPILPLSSCSLRNTKGLPSSYGKEKAKPPRCSNAVVDLMMEGLLKDMMEISF